MDSVEPGEPQVLGELPLDWPGEVAHPPSTSDPVAGLCPFYLPRGDTAAGRLSTMLGRSSVDCVPLPLWPILLLETTSRFNFCFTEEETEAQLEREFAWERSASE